VKLHLVNPNTTPSMTDKARTVACSVAAKGSEIIATQPDDGPVSIEGYYDEAIAVPAMLQKIQQHNNCDGHIIACFDDTGLDAARCIANGPVVGICEAACHSAMMLANTFSIVTTLSRSVPALMELSHRYGVSSRCVSIRASDIPVLSLEDPASNARAQLEREIAEALLQDKAEAIVLGCAGMADLANALADQFEVPVIDGVGAAVKILEGLIAQGLSTSRARGYAKPLAKEYRGSFSGYAPVTS